MLGPLTLVLSDSPVDGCVRTWGCLSFLPFHLAVLSGKALVLREARLACDVDSGSMRWPWALSFIGPWPSSCGRASGTEPAFGDLVRHM